MCDKLFILRTRCGTVAHGEELDVVPQPTARNQICHRGPQRGTRLGTVAHSRDQIWGTAIHSVEPDLVPWPTAGTRFGTIAQNREPDFAPSLQRETKFVAVAHSKNKIRRCKRESSKIFNIKISQQERQHVVLVERHKMCKTIIYAGPQGSSLFSGRCTDFPRFCLTSLPLPLRSLKNI